MRDAVRVTAVLGLGLLFLALGSIDSWAQEGAGVTLTKKSMTRTEDFVVVYGNQIKSNLNKKINTFSLFACIDGKMQPVPFQVDEINKDGEWVLPQVPPYLKEAEIRVDKDDDDGRLDGNDQLVFMIKDTGDRAKKEAYPNGAVSVDEIMLLDPVDQGKSWVYLCSFNSQPPLSTRDYVNYVFPQNRVISDDYELGFSLKVPVSWDYISFRGAPNMIDRMKIRFSLIFAKIPYRLNEENFTSKLSLYKDGQIRVIRRVRSSIKINDYLKTPSAASESIYYSNTISIPFRISLPISPKPAKKLFGLQIKVRGGVDMQNMHGWRMHTDADPRWMAIDGKMDDVEKNVKGAGATWFLAVGPPGAMLNRMVLNKKPDGTKQELPITTNFFYVDDDKTPEPPEFVPGQSPNLGYWMGGMEDLPAGTFYFYLINYMMKGDYQMGKENEYLKIMDKQVVSFIH